MRSATVDRRAAGAPPGHPVPRDSPESREPMDSLERPDARATLAALASAESAPSTALSMEESSSRTELAAKQCLSRRTRSNRIVENPNSGFLRVVIEFSSKVRKSDTHLFFHLYELDILFSVSETSDLISQFELNSLFRAKEEITLTD